jgi:hypothetical protein
MPLEEGGVVELPLIAEEYIDRVSGYQSEQPYGKNYENNSDD